MTFLRQNIAPELKCEIRIKKEEIKNEKNKKFGCSHFETGAAFPKVFTPTPEGAHLEFDGSFQLLCKFSRPTAKEKNAFKSGVPQFDLAIVDDFMFFLARFGTLNWMDAPFNIHLYPDNRGRLLEEPGPTQGYSIHVMLIDSATGILVQQRLIGLDHDLSMRLREAIINQPVIPDYEKRLQSIMAQHSTMDLVALASGCPASNKGQSDMAASVPQLPPSHGESNGADDKSPEPCFNHFTINTGHNLVQTKEFFPNDPAVNEKLRKLAQDSLTPEGAEVIGNVRFRAKVEDGHYFGSVFSLVDGEEIPLLLTSGAKTEDSGKKVWEQFQNSILKRPNAVKMRDRRPSAPFVTDYIFSTSFELRRLMGLLSEDELEFLGSGMSGDFCKCMGWVFLFPEFLAS